MAVMWMSVSCHRASPAQHTFHPSRASVSAKAFEISSRVSSRFAAFERRVQPATTSCNAANGSSFPGPRFSPRTGSACRLNVAKKKAAHKQAFRKPDLGTRTSCRQSELRGERGGNEFFLVCDRARVRSLREDDQSLGADKKDVPGESSKTAFPYGIDSVLDANWSAEGGGEDFVKLYDKRSMELNGLDYTDFSSMNEEYCESEKECFEKVDAERRQMEEFYEKWLEKKAKGQVGSDEIPLGGFREGVFEEDRYPGLGVYPYLAAKDDPEPNDEFYDYVPVTGVDPHDMDMIEKMHTLLHAVKDFLHPPKDGPEVNIFLMGLVSPLVVVENPLFSMQGARRYKDWLEFLSKAGTFLYLEDIYSETLVKHPDMRWIYAYWHLTLTVNLEKKLAEHSLADWWHASLPAFINQVQSETAAADEALTQERGNKPTRTKEEQPRGGEMVFKVAEEGEYDWVDELLDSQGVPRVNNTYKKGIRVPGFSWQEDGIFDEVEDGEKIEIKKEGKYEEPRIEENHKNIDSGDEESPQRSSTGGAEAKRRSWGRKGWEKKRRRSVEKPEGEIVQLSGVTKYKMDASGQVRVMKGLLSECEEQPVYSYGMGYL